MTDRTGYVFDSPGVILFPFRQHRLDLLALEIGLRTAQVAGDDGKLPAVRISCDIFFSAIGQWTDHDMPFVVRQQLGRHGFDPASVEQVQEQCFDDVVPVVAQSDTADTVFTGKAVQRTPAQTGTQSTGGPALGYDSFDHAVGVLFDDMKRQTQWLKILGQDMRRKARLFLIEIDSDQIKTYRSPLL